jgi:hypothetical protein
MSKRGSAHELRSSETVESQRPLAHATSGMGEGWGEGRTAFGVPYFRRSDQPAADLAVSGPPLAPDSLAAISLLKTA